jgi:hypothetical protein
MEGLATNGSAKRLLVGSLLVFCYCLAVGFGPHALMSATNGSPARTSVFVAMQASA